MWKGYVLVIVSSLAFATLGVFVVLGFDAGVNVTTAVVWRFMLSGAVSWGVARAGRQRLPGWRDTVVLAVLGMGLYTAMAGFFYEANRYAPLGVASAVLYIYPALVTGLVALFGWERIGGYRIVSLLGAGAGVLLIVLSGPNQAGSGSTVLAGALMALAAAVVYAVYIAAGSRILQRVPAAMASAIILSAASVGVGAFGLASGQWQAMPAGAWGPVIGQALVPTVVAGLTFFSGVQRIGPARAAIVSTIEPVGAALLGWLLFGQQLTASEDVGGILVLASVAVLRGDTPRLAKSPGSGSSPGYGQPIDGGRDVAGGLPAEDP